MREAHLTANSNSDDRFPACRHAKRRCVGATVILSLYIAREVSCNLFLISTCHRTQ